MFIHPSRINSVSWLSEDLVLFTEAEDDVILELEPYCFFNCSCLSKNSFEYSIFFGFLSNSCNDRSVFLSIISTFRFIGEGDLQSKFSVKITLKKKGI